MPARNDAFGTLRTLELSGRRASYHSLAALEEAAGVDISRFPKTLKILLESVLRNVDGYSVRREDVLTVAGWTPRERTGAEFPFKPARVVLQDFTGVPSIVDLAALRDACREMGGDPSSINPLVPCDLVIDHSVQVDYYGSVDSFRKNLEKEFQRNRERYEFLKWGQQAFDNFRVVPPGTGIVHQVNLEHLATVVRNENGLAFPDSLVGTDSHTTMINGLGVVGWGVGGIEAEAVMLGQPLYMLLPEVVGFRLRGRLSRHASSTDLVLKVTEMLRSEGVVGAFVEFFGPGLPMLSLPDRATVANMSPEYGATMGYFPVDDVTIGYLEATGRGEHAELAERYSRVQGLWHEAGHEPVFSRMLELDLGSVTPSIAGPKRPQDRIDLDSASQRWRRDLETVYGRQGADGASAMVSEGGVAVQDAPDPGRNGISAVIDGRPWTLRHGSVVIAAITSCTNTSNPKVLIAAALLARAARKRGMKVKPWVKTSFAPGSRVVVDYLSASGLMDDLEALGFANVGFGCTTCIGNSGPLPGPVAEAVVKGRLIVAGVLSGNRNFEGRINPLVKANYLASPLLVVAYALAGSMAVDMLRDPLGMDASGAEVLLRDILPDAGEIERLASSLVREEYFVRRYAEVHRGTEEWRAIHSSGGELYEWDPASGYIRRPPFFQGIAPEPERLQPIRGARVLALFGDSVTTDHISPAGAILPGQPAGRYLVAHGVEPADFNSFGSRRGNHEVMMRGTFDNIRVRNRLAPGTEGGFTTCFVSGDDGEPAVMTIFDAAMRYREAATPLIVMAGRDYGMGSSRDWAAKGTFMLGVRAVIAESFERIHRSNLVGMGVLPLQFLSGESASSIGIEGNETFDIAIGDSLEPGAPLTVEASPSGGGAPKTFEVLCRLDSPVEVEYYRNGGILQTVLRNILRT
ncbi:aconitate hydratase 1 [Prosthecochloris sp. GSB1]|uniref:aconitate hydratase AcnA n=1 Tax=Prosthecochloris sp. GSB1 TaxID=281093 RepID=UPI000B8C8D9C|nr:aconitate hydratase AcnA [Prosthecochloris sp. GSB1]ASQ91451.1 aconitate hydratase 1 [Prosthecochloris sp. GSB1]